MTRRLRTALLSGLVAAALATTAACTAGPAARSGPGPTTGTATQSTPAPPAPPTTTPTPTPEPRPELPRGGREIFPEYRLVGFAGHPAARALGRLGIGDLDERAREIEKVGEPLAHGREVLPVLELIATVVQGAPGRDGMYRSRSGDDLIQRHLDAARKVKGILLLDIQPGRSDFLTEVKYYERWLREPDVGVALDPEWAMGPRDVPMRVFGSTTGPKLDAVTKYLSELVAKYDLPEKVMVYHQLAPNIVRNEKGLKERPGVVLVKSVDGIGSKAMKEETYLRLTKDMPSFVHAGFKLFYEEDREFGPLMTPKQVLALKPRPEYVLYE